MGKFAIGAVVLVSFPFSNLKGQKIRPSLVVGHAEFDNLILCQITSKPYSSKIAIQLNSHEFLEGRLPIVSYIRPDKLFTADTTIIKRTVGVITDSKKKIVLKYISGLFSL